MMNSMLNEHGVSFKDLEKKIFEAACGIARDAAKEILESYDDGLAQTRDRKKYRDKGRRKTVIKTVFGEVEYSRRIYRTETDEGIRYVYLLDEELDINRIGKFSENMAEILVDKVCESSYRVSAQETSHTTGQTVSHTGVWNIIQALGCECERRDNELIKRHKEGMSSGERKAPVLFEEADGIYISLQQEKNEKCELKAGIAYDGWEKIGSDRYALSGKMTVCTARSAKGFRELFEASISEIYDTDETDIRILNADGAGWIRKLCGPDDVFQLDPFHRNRAIREKLPYEEARNAVHEYLDAQDIDGMFRYLEIYSNSLSEDDEIASANELITYFRDNSDGLIPYRDRGLDLPESRAGLEYRGMGTMEAHNWSVIAKRMKHNHTSWSIEGADNLARILARRDCGRLGDVTERIDAGRFTEEVLQEADENILSAARISRRIGNGYLYPVRGSLPKFAGSTGPVSRAFKDHLIGL